MAMLPGSHGRSIGGRRAAPMPLAEINVTPFVDVMLVLLVVFMITAPLVTAGVEVDLPRARAPQIASDRKPIEIAIDGAGQLHIGTTPVPRDRFMPALAAMARAAGDPAAMRVFVRADRALEYGAVMEIVSEISAVGFTKVAFLSDPKPPPATAAGVAGDGSGR